jgi:hypothetical protein
VQVNWSTAKAGLFKVGLFGDGRIIETIQVSPE